MKEKLTLESTIKFYWWKNSLLRIVSFIMIIPIAKITVGTSKAPIKKNIRKITLGEILNNDAEEMANNQINDLFQCKPQN